jgi:transglutaminase-like putative cysteine protease
MSSCSRSCARSERGAARARVPLAVAAALWVAAACLGAPPEVLEEHWYRLTLAGSPCGWMHERTVREGDVLRTETESSMQVGRMGQAVTVRSRNVFEERMDGTPVRVETERGTGRDVVKGRWAFTAKGIEVTQEQGGRTSTQVVPAPAPGWLAPAAADRFVRAREAAGEVAVRYVTIDPESGPTAVTVERTRVGEAAVDVGDGPVKCVEWRVAISLLERPTGEWVRADGVAVKSTVDLGIGVLESVLSTRDAATAPIRGAEVMARTFIEVPQDARAIAGAQTAELRVRARDGSLGDVPSAGAQAFARAGAGDGRVTIDAGRGSAATEAERADARFTAPSAMVDCADARIKSLAARAVQGVGDDARARSRAMRRATWSHLRTKNLAKGLATASEAAESRAGDCTEHAVLLAAMLRAEGIPSRVATGLCYVADAGTVRNAYGWHMWTQAIVGGEWIDLDATLPADGPDFVASRLMTGSSAADGGSIDADLARIVNMIGDLEIDVLRIDGRELAAAGAPARDGDPAKAAP